MKKYLLIVSVIIFFAIFAVVLYSNYTETKLKEYLVYIPGPLERFTGEKIENFRLERLIKKSPVEIIILVKWDNNSAFVSIKDWLLPKSHDEIEICVFDSKHRIKIYE